MNISSFKRDECSLSQSCLNAENSFQRDINTYKLLNIFLVTENLLITDFRESYFTASLTETTRCPIIKCETFFLTIIWKNRIENTNKFQTHK